MRFNRLLSSSLAAMALVLAVAPLAHARDMVSVKGSVVNMRSGPGLKAPVTWTIPQGYPLQVVGRKGDWVQVRDFENDKGWVKRSLTTNKPHHVVKAPVANIRSAPNTGSRIVGKAERGDVLRTLQTQGNWVKVHIADQGPTGWVARSLLWGW